MLLLETLGSRPVNTAVGSFLLLATIGVLYGTLFVNRSLAICSDSLNAVGDNVWYDVALGWKAYIDSNVTSLDSIESSRNLLKGLLTSRVNNASTWTYYEVGQDGLLPSCKWGSEKYLEFLSQNATHFDWELDEFDVGDLVGDFFNSDPQDRIDDFWFLLEIISNINLFFPVLVSDYDFIFDCMLRNSSRLVCQPCGDLERLQVSFDGNEFTDLLSGFKFQNVSLLSARCVNLILFSFLEPCVALLSPEEYIKDNPPIEVHHDATNSGPSTNDAAKLVAQLAGNVVLPPGIFWHTFYNVSSLLMIDTESRDNIKRSCSGKDFNVLQLMAFDSNHSFTSNETDITLIQCWELYSLFMWQRFLKPDALHKSCVNTAISSPEDNITVTSRVETSISTAFLSLLFNSNFALTSNTTSYARGYPSFPYFATENTPFVPLIRLDNASKDNRTVYDHMLETFPGVDIFILPQFTAKMFQDPSCTDFVETAGKDLETFIGSISELSDCVSSSNDLFAAEIAAICLFSLTAVFCVSLVLNGLFNPFSRLHTASILFLTAVTCSYIPTLTTAIYYMRSEWTVFVSNHFLTTHEKLAQFNIHSLIAGLLLSTFFYTYVYMISMLALDTYPTVRHSIFTLFYFILRGGVCPFIFHANPGMVPFVNWITVIRICTLPNVSAFPNCYFDLANTHDPYGSFPFWGNILATSCDIVAIVLCKSQTRICHQMWKTKSFTDSRTEILGFKLIRLLTAVMLGCVLLNGIVYTCTVVLGVS